MNIYNNKIIKKYTPLLLQEYYLSNSNNICKCILEIRGNYGAEFILEAVRILVHQNSTFRSVYDEDKSIIRI